MKNKKFEGKTLQYKNPSSSVTIESGSVILLAARICVSVADISPLKSGSVELEGVFEVPKKTGEAFTFGQQLYADATTKELTGTASGNIYAGICADTDGRANAEVVAQVRLQS